MVRFIDSILSPAALAMGTSLDEFKLVFCFFLSFPFAMILRCMGFCKAWVKDTFCISVTLFYLLGLFNLWKGLQTLAISVTVAYILARYVDHNSMPWIALAFLMGHLAVSHIKRQAVNDDSRVDITGVQMVLVIKLSSFCWYVHDNRCRKDKCTGKDSHQYTNMPNILDFLAYLLFFPELFAGPACEFSEFQRYIHTGCYGDALADAEQSRVPVSKFCINWQSITTGIKRGFQGVAWLCAFAYAVRYFPVSRLTDIDQFAQYSLPGRVSLICLVTFAVRMKYYAVWNLAEGADILCGMGYSGRVNGKTTWNDLRNIKPLKIETAGNIHAYIEGWNVRTNLWLRQSVFTRVARKGQKPGFAATMATFMVSAFWHGMYPGYYFTFVLAGLMQAVAKKARKNVRPYFVDGKFHKYKRVYDVITWFLTKIVMDFTAIPFIVLRWDWTKNVWRQVYYYGIIAIGLGMVGVNMLEKMRQKHGSKNERIIEQTKAA